MLLNSRGYDADKIRDVVRCMAMLCADDITSEQSLAENIGRMKSSEAAADLECKAAEKQAGELREDIHRIEIYLHNRDGQFPNQEWLEVCRRSAEKYGVVNISGLDRLNAELEDITKKANGLEVRRQFYCCKARELSRVRQTISDIRRGGYDEKNIHNKHDRSQEKQMKSANKKRQR